MNATISQPTLRSQETCIVVVIYDTDEMRSRAIAAHQYLLERCRGNVDLQFHWWRTAFLTDPLLADLAAQNALASDCLMICLEDDPAVSPSLESWFESWIERRTGGDGALVDLAPHPSNGNGRSMRETFLRDLCRRGGLDWVTPPSPPQASPERLPFLLDEFQDRLPYPHFGLNE
jgi:hypothetical protein